MLEYLDYNNEVILKDNAFEVLTSNAFKPFYVIQTPERDIKRRWFNAMVGESRLRVVLVDGTINYYSIVDCSSESTIKRFSTLHNINKYKKITLDAIYTYVYNHNDKKYIKIATCVRKYNTPNYLITESFIKEVFDLQSISYLRIEEYRVYNFGKPNEWKLIL